MTETKLERGWCDYCGIAWPPRVDESTGQWLCPRCPRPMKRPNELKSRDEKRAFRLNTWLDEVWMAGKWGPSPGGAASDLHCDRSMIDKLSERGILEKSVYDRDGHYIVMISTRSVDKAKENKKLRGKWTDSGEG